MEHKLRVKDIIDIAAPHTWAASVMPSIFAVVLAYSLTGSIRADMTVCLFIVAVCMQSSVNALNDYADYVKGTDTLDNSPDAEDAVIVYGLAPKTARNIGIAFLAAAFIPGLYTVYVRGVVPLIIGLIGAFVIVAYSAGKTPISYLPLGELVSGFVMGGLIPLAGIYMQTGELDLFVLVRAVPIIMGTGMIMFSNNGCDIEKDQPVGRHTLPCILGRERTDVCYRIMLVLWLISPVIILGLFGHPFSVLFYLLEALVFFSGLMRQFSFQLGAKFRGPIMGGINTLNISIGFAYILAILV